MKAGELISYFPTVDTVDWYMKKEDKFVKHHTTCGIRITSGLVGENYELPVLKVEISSFTKLDVYINKDWED